MYSCNCNCNFVLEFTRDMVVKFCCGPRIIKDRLRYAKVIVLSSEFFRAIVKQFILSPLICRAFFFLDFYESFGFF